MVTHSHGWIGDKRPPCCVACAVICDASAEGGTESGLRRSGEGGESRRVGWDGRGLGGELGIWIWCGISGWIWGVYVFCWFGKEAL